MDSYESSDADSDNEKASSARSDGYNEGESNNEGSNQSDVEAGSMHSEAGSVHSDGDGRSSVGNQSDDAQSERSDADNNASDVDERDAQSVQSNQSDDEGNRSEGDRSEAMEEGGRAGSSDANDSDDDASPRHDPVQSDEEKSTHSGDRSDQEKDPDSSDRADSDDDQSKGRQSAATDYDDKSDADQDEKSDNEEEHEEGGAASAASDVEEQSDKSPRSDQPSDAEMGDKKSDDSDHDSDSDNKVVPSKKRKQIESDDEGSHQAGSEREVSDGGETPKKPRLSLTSDDDGESEKPKADDLFGDADDISDESGAEDKQEEDKQDDDDDDEVNKETQEGETEDLNGISHSPILDGEEGEEAPPEEIPETRIDVEIPKITADLGKELHFVKLPNFLSVETRPFDHQTYEDEIEEDEVLDEEGRARLKLKVENTIRWRWGFNEDGNPVKESNARIVRWSDGSMSLHLGSEIFDIHKQLLQRDHNHLFIRQGTGLQGQAVFRTKLTFRPHSTDSFTHRKITISVADRSQKIQKIRVLPNVGKDPEAHRSEMIKKEEDRLKASIRRESKQRRMKERAQSRGLSSSYLEPDRYDDEDEDDEGAISLAAIKNKYKKGNIKDNRPSIYSSDSDASDIESHRSRRLEKAKVLADSEEEEEEGHSEDSTPKKKVARIEDSEEEEEED